MNELAERLQDLARLFRALEVEISQLRLEIDLGYFRTAEEQERIHRRRRRRLRSRHG